MAIFSLKSKEVLSNLTAPANIDLGAMIPIATTTLNTATATINFSSIPQNYEHLQIRGIARSATGSAGQDDLSITLNSDTGNNYYWHRFGSNGTGTITGAATALTSGNQFQELIARDGQGANVFSIFIIDILDYTNTNKYKTMRCFGGDDNNGSGAILLDSALWLNTSAINSITFQTSSNFKTYSSFALYGIKKAGA